MIFLWVISLSSCTSGFDEYECFGDNQAEIFIMGPELISKNVFNDVIEISGLKNKGYSVVITSAAEKDSKPISNLLAKIKQLKLNANHVISISDSIKITNAESIEISHANLVIVAFSERYFHQPFLEDSALVSAIKRANNSGAMLIAIGAGADLFGAKSVVSTSANEDVSATQIELMEGLGFVKNMLIDKSSFFDNHKTWIENFAEKHNMVCFGIGGKTMLKICDKNLVIIKPQDMVLLENGKLMGTDQIFKGQKIASD